jgi:hypothetical protein
MQNTRICTNKKRIGIIFGLFYLIFLSFSLSNNAYTIQEEDTRIILTPKAASTIDNNVVYFDGVTSSMPFVYDFQTEDDCYFVAWAKPNNNSKSAFVDVASKTTGKSASSQNVTADINAIVLKSSAQTNYNATISTTFNTCEYNFEVRKAITVTELTESNAKYHKVNINSTNSAYMFQVTLQAGVTYQNYVTVSTENNFDYYLFNLESNEIVNLSNPEVLAHVKDYKFVDITPKVTATYGILVISTEKKAELTFNIHEYDASAIDWESIIISVGVFGGCCVGIIFLVKKRKKSKLRDIASESLLQNITKLVNEGEYLKVEQTLEIELKDNSNITTNEIQPLNQLFQKVKFYNVIIAAFKRYEFACQSNVSDSVPALINLYKVMDHLIQNKQLHDPGVFSRFDLQMKTLQEKLANTRRGIRDALDNIRKVGESIENQALVERYSFILNNAKKFGITDFDNEIQEKIERLNALQKISHLFAMTNKMKISDVEVSLKMDRSKLLNYILEWQKSFPGLKIDGEFLILNAEKVDDFIGMLDSNFSEWGDKELSKDGKIE